MSAISSQTALDARYPASASQLPAIRRAVADAARERGAGETALLQIALAVSEAATNAIMHAYRDRAAADVGAVHVLVRHDADRLDVHVRDSGLGPRPRPDSPGLGMGLSLMAHESDTFEINALEGGGTEVVMRFAL